MLIPLHEELPLFGDCSFCSAKHGDPEKSTLIYPELLRDKFESLLDCYEECTDGSALVDLLRRDWGYFSSEGSPIHSNAELLLSEILDDSGLMMKKYSHRKLRSDTFLHPEGWEDFRRELMHANRWFVSRAVGSAGMKYALKLLARSSISVSDEWFRARNCEGGEEIALVDMGAPPASMATHGRANPAGISVLYLANEAEVAVSEIRPHPGDRVTIARFQIDDVEVVDLTDVLSRISPFDAEQFDDSDNSAFLAFREAIDLLCRLESELKKPINPRASAYAYAPSQYICEYIKSEGYRGVVFGSSMTKGTGVSLALFDPEGAKAIDSVSASIEGVSVEMEYPRWQE